MLAGYDHLLAAARRLQWDAEAIDLSADAATAVRLAAGDRATLRRLTGGFCLAERAVATELEPFVAAAGAATGDEAAAARECFAVQRGDETRHARFFERVTREVLGEDPAALAAGAGPALVELFADRLPAAAAALAADATTIADAVGLYHLVLEGIVFAVGQAALLELAAANGLTGVGEGVARVQADERWHVGLGVLHLQRAGARVDVADAAALATRAWGPAIATPERIAAIRAVHARRLAIATPDRPGRTVRA